MAGLDEGQIAACLALLREADAMLMAADELSIAVHLSLVIELLEERAAPA